MLRCLNPQAVEDVGKLKEDSPWFNDIIDKDNILIQIPLFLLKSLSILQVHS